jgi:replicative DNA helicase
VLEEHSDMVLLLYWAWFYTRKPEDKNKYEIIVAKNRNGKTGKHECMYTPEFYLFEENEPVDQSGSPQFKDSE